MLSTIKTCAALFFVSFLLALMTGSVAHAQQCPVNSILIKGRVEHAPRHPSVRVQLIYSPDLHKSGKHGDYADGADRHGESAEAILDGATFTIPVEFVTSDRRTAMNFNPRCEHKPQTVVITLQESGASAEDVREYDHVSLDFPHDFKSEDSRHYTVRGEVVLDGEQP
jgi:hypothetical protein